MTQTLCILGGTGFVGQHLAHRLAGNDCQVRILTRHPERHRELTTNPCITLHQADVHNAEHLRKYLHGADIVVNLVGILNDRDRKGSNFLNVHVELPRKIVFAALDAGVSRLLHMSALNADVNEKNSLYLKTKGAGEDLVHAAATRQMIVTTLRPSLIFGEGADLFTRFAGLLRLAPGLFPLACPQSRFAPVYVGDVVEAMRRAMHDATGGERLELCGPETFTLKCLVEYTRDQLGTCHRIIGLGDRLSRLQARLLGLLPGQPFSIDNYYSLQKDSICNCNALPSLGINPTPISAVVPGYLAGRNSTQHFHVLRRHAGRD